MRAAVLVTLLATAVVFVPAEGAGLDALTQPAVSRPAPSVYAQQRAHLALDGLMEKGLVAVATEVEESVSTEIREASLEVEEEAKVAPAEEAQLVEKSDHAAEEDAHGAHDAHDAHDAHGAHDAHDSHNAWATEAHGAHDAHDAHDECGHAHGHSHHMNGSASYDDEMAITMILFLIALTIGFEKIKHQAEHGRAPSEKLVVNALFGEVTVLGFIALVTFFMIKSGMFETLSMLVYHDDTHMLHLFEDVHFGLFFTMMLYLALVIWVLIVQQHTKRRWKSLEEQTRRFLREAGIGDKKLPAHQGPKLTLGKVKPPVLPMPRDEYLEWRYNGGGRIPVGFDGVMHREDDMDIEV
ncbi:hypothetical protein T492DRAFT_31038 [Pavlovales sp. CCMP2436]|nr:hypothetical protein T492DRAFT_31038 [Pavlovales sp. CCMP2436]